MGTPRAVGWANGAPLFAAEDDLNSESEVQRLERLDYLAAIEAAKRCCIREGETLAEFIRRLYEETTADE